MAKPGELSTLPQVQMGWLEAENEVIRLLYFLNGGAIALLLSVVADWLRNTPLDQGAIILGVSYSVKLYFGGLVANLVATSTSYINALCWTTLLTKQLSERGARINLDARRLSLVVGIVSACSSALFFIAGCIVTLRLVTSWAAYVH